MPNLLKAEPVFCAYMVRILSLALTAIGYFHLKMDPRLLGGFHFLIEAFTSIAARQSVTPVK